MKLETTYYWLLAVLLLIEKGPHHKIHKSKWKSKQQTSPTGRKHDELTILLLSFPEYDHTCSPQLQL